MELVTTLMSWPKTNQNKTQIKPKPELTVIHLRDFPMILGHSGHTRGLDLAQIAQFWTRQWAPKPAYEQTLCVGSGLLGEIRTQRDCC